MSEWTLVGAPGGFLTNQRRLPRLSRVNIPASVQKGPLVAMQEKRN
jgi:hypothetical protein